MEKHLHAVYLICMSQARVSTCTTKGRESSADYCSRSWARGCPESEGFRNALSQLSPSTSLARGGRDGGVGQKMEGADAGETTTPLICQLLILSPARAFSTDSSYIPFSTCSIMSLYNEQELADHKRYSQI
jgi:hypothetical protein